MTKGYLVSSGWGAGKCYFYLTLQEAQQDKHKHWKIEEVIKHSDCYEIIKEIRSWGER